jgi:hypothetical protein
LSGSSFAQLEKCSWGVITNPSKCLFSSPYPALPLYFDTFSDLNSAAPRWSGFVDASVTSSWDFLNVNYLSSAGSTLAVQRMFSASGAVVAASPRGTYSNMIKSMPSNGLVDSLNLVNHRLSLQILNPNKNSVGVGFRYVDQYSPMYLVVFADSYPRPCSASPTPHRALQLLYRTWSSNTPSDAVLGSYDMFVDSTTLYNVTIQVVESIPFGGNSDFTSITIYVNRQPRISVQHSDTSRPRDGTVTLFGSAPPLYFANIDVRPISVPLLVGQIGRTRSPGSTHFGVTATASDFAMTLYVKGKVNPGDSDYADLQSALVLYVKRAGFASAADSILTSTLGQASSIQVRLSFSVLLMDFLPLCSRFLLLCPFFSLAGFMLGRH